MLLVHLLNYFLLIVIIKITVKKQMASHLARQCGFSCSAKAWDGFCLYILLSVVPLKYWRVYLKQLYKIIYSINIQVQHDPVKGDIIANVSKCKEYVRKVKWKFLSSSAFAGLNWVQWVEPNMDRHPEHHLRNPPSSSTLQITLAVASGAQIITLCYFSSHTLLLNL